jgi:glycosyltransferase involved in cell wall biosynthesis
LLPTRATCPGRWQEHRRGNEECSITEKAFRDNIRETELSNPSLSVVVPTRNRAENLEAAITALLAQSSSDFELVPVDNGSSDGTWDCLNRMAATDRRVRPAREPRPGISFARNAGIAQARAPIVAFTDDDVRVSPDWAETIIRSFAEYPEASAIGGRVLPVWPSDAPDWLDRSAWGPLALVDYGEGPIRVDRERPLCLIGANVAMRTSAFADIGLFSPAFPRGQDQEWLERLYRSGGHGMYIPWIAIASPVPLDRMTKRYHRRWHFGRGRFLARMRLAQLEATRTGRLLDVPGHVWRSLASELRQAIAASLGGRPAEAFEHECAAWCRLGFMRERVQAFAHSSPRSVEQFAAGDGAST